MNGGTHILQPVQPVNLPAVENQQIIEQTIVATVATDSIAVTTHEVKTEKIENRFARLKKSLRKRSAAIL